MDMITTLNARLAIANLAEVAVKADVARKTLDRIRSGANSPTLRTVTKINKALDELKVRAPKGVSPKSRAPEERVESATAGAQE